MGELLALKETPLPTVLVIGGLFLFALALAGKIGAVIELTRGWSRIISGFFGLILLGVGIGLYLLPANQNIALSPTSQLPVASQATQVPTPDVSITVTQLASPTQVSATSQVTQAPTPDVPTTAPQVTMPAQVPTVISEPPTPVASEIVSDTLEGSVISMDEIWRQNSLTAAISDFNLNGFKCKSWSVWGQWNVTITNNTKQNLLLNLNTEDLSLIDDTGKSTMYYVVPADYQYCNLITPPDYIMQPPGNIDIINIPSNSSVKIRVYGVGKIDNEEYYIFGIKDAGRIRNARWRIVIPH